MTPEERLTPAERIKRILEGWGYGEGKTSVTELSLVHFWTIFSAHITKLISCISGSDTHERHVGGDDELEGVFEILKNPHLNGLVKESVNGSLEHSRQKQVRELELIHNPRAIRFIFE